MKVEKTKLRNIAIVLCLAAMMASCGTKQEDMAQIPLIDPPADAPALVKVEYGEVENSIYYNGMVAPKTTILQFPEDGIFLEYGVNIGDYVKKGDLIATCDEKYEKEIKDLKEQIADLETAYTDTMTNFDLQIQTSDWKIGQRREWIEHMDSDAPGFDDICIDFELLISKGERIKLCKRQYDERTQLEQKHLEEKLARYEEKNNANRIVAPFDGTITYLADLQIGDPVNVKSYPVAISNTDTKYIQCEYFSAQEIDELSRVYCIVNGQSFDLTFVPYDTRELQEKSVKGEGTYSFFTVDDEKATMNFGDSVIVATVRQERKNTLIVPNLCIKKDGDKSTVDVSINGERKTVEIETGISDKISTEVLSGLKEGEMVYVSD